MFYTPRMPRYVDKRWIKSKFMPYAMVTDSPSWPFWERNRMNENL